MCFHNPHAIFWGIAVGLILAAVTKVVLFEAFRWRRYTRNAKARMEAQVAMLAMHEEIEKRNRERKGIRER